MCLAIPALITELREGELACVDMGGVSKEISLALLDDCAVGAVPPMGPAYGLEVIIDDSLNNQAEIFFEGGDHQELIHITGADFQRLLPDALHGSFSHMRAAGFARSMRQH